MTRDGRDLSPAWARTGPLLAAGPWLRRAAPAQRRLHVARKPVGTAINSEAPVIIFHDGWYYLLATDGACSSAANSTCNIRIGRSRNVTGPFVDNMGIEMDADGGGSVLDIRPLL
jgi:beta-xylosidase